MPPKRKQRAGKENMQSVDEWTIPNELETARYREVFDVMLDRLRHISEDASVFENFIAGNFTVEQLYAEESKIRERRESYQKTKDISVISVKAEDVRKEQIGLETYYRKTIEDQRRHIKELTNKLEQSKKDLQKPKEIAIVSMKANDAKKTHEELETQKRQIIEDQKRQIEELRNQLGQRSKGTNPFAGSKLTDTCSDIPYLCDQNRPMRLAEKFLEVHENEWMDAMEEIYDKEGEKTAICILLTIVQDAYTHCQKASEDLLISIMSSMNQFLTPEEMPQDVRQLCKDHSKTLAVHIENSVQKLFLKKQRKYADRKKFPNMVKYIEKCAQLTWLMIMQDPMIVLDTSVPNNLDLDIYKPYTKQGPRMDYLVWPPVYLQTTDGGNGPLLEKGVAQGRK